MISLTLSLSLSFSHTDLIRIAVEGHGIVRGFLPFIHMRDHRRLHPLTYLKRGKKGENEYEREREEIGSEGERERERGKVVRISVRVCEKERKRPWRGIFRDFHCNTG